VTLKVLVIGKGAAEPQSVSNGHTLEFAHHAGLAPDFLSLQPYSFVFMHLGPLNPEARDAIRTWSASGWREKVIGFSGGDIPSWCDGLAVDAIERMPNRNSFLELHWGAVGPDFAGTAAELLALLSGNSCETLVSLAVLCQGYLALYAAHTGPEGLSGEPDEVRDALSEMGWDALGGKLGRGELESWAAPSNVKDLVAEVSAPGWWRKVWKLEGDAGARLKRWDAVVARLRNECARRGTPETPKEIAALLDVLRPDEGDGAPGPAVPPVIVSNAYRAIAGILSK
jgi:hypothetical protein